MTLVLLAFTSHLYVLSVTGSDWKYVSPCAVANSHGVMERFEIHAPLPNRSARCNREAHVLKLIRILIKSA